MKMKTKILILLVLAVTRLAWADLSAVVQPGYVFGSNERPSTSTLNRLGMPTITITGTVGGTNAAVAAGSINGTHFSDTVVDGTNITFNTASPRALKIVNAGVDVTQISTNIAGNGLGGGSGTNLYLQLDTNATPGLAITDDRLYLTNIPPFRLTVTSNYVVMGTTNNTGLAVPFDTLAAMLRTNASFTPYTTTFTSYEYDLAVHEIANTNHSLGATPGQLRWVMVCKTAENGFAVGDEFDAGLAMDTTTDHPTFMYGANSTNVWITASTVLRVSVLGRDESTGSLTPSRWRLKCYARP